MPMQLDPEKILMQDHAVAMLGSGWTVRRVGDELPQIAWRSPRGISGSEYLSASLDLPPLAAIQDAKKHHDI